jgi:hypothetical protein
MTMTREACARTKERIYRHFVSTPSRTRTGDLLRERQAS